jgi:hypothetical protein
MDVQKMAMLFIDNGLTVSWTLYPAAGESRVVCVWGGGLEPEGFQGYSAFHFEIQGENVVLTLSCLGKTVISGGLYFNMKYFAIGADGAVGG